MKISKELYTFFKEWLEWADAGGKEHNVFVTACGLCSNFNEWMLLRGRDGCGEELEILLDYTFFDTIYPFGKAEYRITALNGTQHKCPKRLAFVREQIKKYEGEVSES